MSIPAADVAVPVRVRELAGGTDLVPVWLNGIGGLTFRTGDGRYIKHGPRTSEASMRDEAERMRWARRWARVPEVITQGEDDAEEWLVTVAINARSAVASRWIAEPAAAVRALGEGLRMLHDALPVADRWADIAVAAMSTEWNYGPGWQDALLEAYGLTPDRGRIAYYQDLWNWNET